MYGAQSMEGAIKGDGDEYKSRTLTLLAFFNQLSQRIITIVVDVSLQVLLLLFDLS